MKSFYNRKYILSMYAYIFIAFKACENLLMVIIFTSLNPSCNKPTLKKINSENRKLNFRAANSTPSQC